MKRLTPVPATSVVSPQKVVATFVKAMDAALNWVFELTYEASRARSRVLTFGFILIWLISIGLVVPTDKFWAALFSLSEALSNLVASPQNLITSLVGFLFTTIFHPVVVRHLLAFFVPYWLMHRITAIYLADVMEKDEQVARKFISQAAFGTSYSTVHIRQGKVAEEDQDSTIIQIGGPGYVVVELDSAVLFERPDGTSHIIQPTDEEVVHDFERLRRVIDLRDSNDKQDVLNVRSRDGILVGAKDIQYSYSIYRGTNPAKSLEKPYPFDSKAVENLVYKDTRIVKSGVAPKRVPEWQSDAPRIAGPIAAEISMFISKRGLSEFLAAIGEPEEKSLTSREQQIDEFSQQLSGRNGGQADDLPLRAGEFSSRAFLTSLFYKQDDFQDRLAKRGFQLNWIGVGTWYTPSEIIPANHREAWKISRENFTRGNTQTLKKLRNEAKLQELLRLVQTIPIKLFYNDLNQVDEDKLVDELLREYEELLRRTVDLYTQGGNSLDRQQKRFFQHAVELERQPRQSFDANYMEFLQNAVSLNDQSVSLNDTEFEKFLRKAVDIHNQVGEELEPEDAELLRDAINLYNDIKAYNQLLSSIKIITGLRFPHHPMGP